MMPEGCLPVSASGRSASGDHGMMSRLACGMELLFFGEPLDDLPANANETWSWEIATEPVALQKPPVKHTKGLAQFRRLSCRSDDVFVCSYPRCGLSWAHALAFHLCRSDEDGSLPYDATRVVGGRGPVLPDTPPTRWSLSDVERQDAPRVFSSHAAVADLPASFAASGARLIVVDRDPRDALVSAFFRLKRLGAKFRAGQQKRAKFPTSKAPISAGFHSFRLIFGRAIISRNSFEAWILFSERARAEHSH